MKKLLLTLLCVFSMFAAKAQCDYVLEMNDSWGDGWAGNSVDVLVNGDVVLDDATFGAGFQATLSIYVNAGDEITTVWNGGGFGPPNYEEETSYRILNYLGDPVGDTAQASIVSPIVATCPACWSPTAVIVGNISTDAADAVRLNGISGSSFNWEVYAGGEAPGGLDVPLFTGTDSNNTINISGLSDGTPYSFFIEANCDSLVQGPFDFITAPSCANPTAAISDITGTGATATWAAANGATSYDWEVVPTGNAQGVGVVASGSGETGLTISITGLAGLTDYDFLISSDCTTDYASAVSFTTACAAITTFPSTTDFTLNPPTACWTQAGNGDPTSGPTDLGSSEWSAGRSYNSLPSNRVNLYNLGTAEWLISPTYDIPALIAHELVVNVAVTNYNSSAADNMGSDDEVQLLQTTDAGVTWTNITTWNAANQPATLGTSFTADLTSLSGTVQFAIWASEGLVDDGEDFDFHVGAFTVREIPSCFEPTDIVITDVVSTTATASWTESNTSASFNFQYEINEVLTTGNVLFLSATTTQDFTTIFGLTVDSEYEIRVRANCGSSGRESYSAWSSFVSWSQTEAPGCALNVTPVDGSTTNTGGTITFTWDAPTTGGAATAYSFVYGTTIPGMFAISTNATSPYTVSGITPGGTFYYQIVPTNAGGEASSCSIQAVTTEAAPAAPQGLTCGLGDESTSKFTESFEPAAAGLWSGDFGGGGGWQFDTNATGSSNTGPTGPQDAGGSYMYYEGTSASGSASAVSPVIDLSSITAGNGAELTFYMHAYGAGMGTLRVGASTSPTGPFTNLLTWGGQYQTASADPWYQIGIDVSAYAGGDLYIEFNNTAGADYRSDMSIDTMEVVACQLIPACALPTDLTVTGQTLTTTDLAWTAGGTETLWNIEVYDFGADTSTATPVYTETGATQTSTTATGLTFGGDYTAYVRADCQGTAGLSDPITTDFSIDYCESTPVSNDGSGITNVQLGTTDFLTGDVTYADYRDTVVDLELDNTANLQVSFATGYSYFTNVWIDFNDNLVFESTELVFQGESLQIPVDVLDASFDIAVDAAQGTHYMRIGTADLGQAAPTPCYGGAYGVTIDMAVNVIIPGSCTTLTIWDGTVWSNGAPDANSYAHIGGAYATGTDGDIDACSLAINAATSVDADGYVDIDGDINVKSVGSLTVAHTGSVVQVQDAATVTNNGTINVQTITPVMAEKSFMISGSPMSSETRAGVYGASYIVRNHDTSLFVPNIAVQTSFPGANNFADETGNNWVEHAGGLNPGEGYMVFPQPDGTSSGTYTQTHSLGTLNTGVINFALDFNSTENDSPNMLANPYPSAIDLDQFFIVNPDISAVFFWEHLTGLSVTYPGYNGSNFDMGDISLFSQALSSGVASANGGDVPVKYISTGQGFGVKATAAGTAVFNNSMRVTNNNDTYRSNNSVEKDRLWMNVYNDSYGLGSTALIGFTENTSDEFSSSEDIDRLPTPVSLYSELETGEELVVNALDTFEFSDAFYLSFSTQIKEVQDYRISIQDLDGINLENATVYLIDSFTGSVTNLTEGDYTFESVEATYSKRFKVEFQNGALGINDSNLDAVSLYPNPTKDVITIVSPQTIVTSAKVFDIRGRIISEVDFSNQGSYQIDLSAMEAAIYFIDITTESGTVNKRVIKKN